MKKLMSYLLAVALCAGFIGCSGCKSATTNTYKTSAITHAGVKAAMGGWNDYVGTGKATPADEQKVKAAYDKYNATQVAMLHIIAEIARTPDDPTNADRLTVAVRAASAALSELGNLLSTFGIKLE